MEKQTVAIVRWSGDGDRASLVRSVRRRLGEDGVEARVESLGGSLVVRGTDPLAVATSVGNLPGVSWVAVGYRGRARDLGDLSSTLAGKYLRRGDKFAVAADAPSAALASDAAGAVTSGALEAAKGARVSESQPKFRFRVSIEGDRAVLGVGIADGPGGFPTGGDRVSVLASGGMHSSVVAWMAAVSGYRVDLVHAYVEERSLRAVSGLYSELSHRIDPTGVRLEVLFGGPPSGLLLGWAKKERGTVFGGFRTGSPVPSTLKGGVVGPLSLASERDFKEKYSALGLKPFVARMDWIPGPSRWTSRVFGGRTADVSEVIDGLA